MSLALTLLYWPTATMPLALVALALVAMTCAVGLPVVARGGQGIPADCGCGPTAQSVGTSFLVRNGILIALAIFGCADATAGGSVNPGPIPGTLLLASVLVPTMIARARLLRASRMFRTSLKRHSGAIREGGIAGAVSG